MGKLARVVDVSSCRSMQEVLSASGTDWDVTTQDAGGGFRRIARPDTDTPLAYVSERFRPNSHREQLAALDAMVTDGTLVPSTVSMWDNGAMMAYQMRAPSLDVTIGNRDVVSPLLTLAFAYSSALADTAFFCDFRWYCKNQMGQVAKLRTDRAIHRGGIIQRFGDIVAKRLGELGGELSDRYTTMRQLREVPLRQRALAEYFGEAVGISKEGVDRAWTMPPDELSGPEASLPRILDCYRVDDAGAEGSVWHAYNAVTRYQTHVDGRSDVTRQRSMLLGRGAAVANRAWDIAARMAA